jgi:hypothetical protein
MSDPDARPLCEDGQASLLFIGIGACAIALGALLLAVGMVLVSRAELQQAADVAAVAYANGVGDQPGSEARQLARANGADDFSVARRDGKHVVTVRVDAPDVLGIRIGGRLEASAIVPPSLAPRSGAGAGVATSGPYRGPLVAVDAAVICPAVAADYRAMQRAAAVSGVRLWAVSGWRSVEEQAALYAQLGPAIAAPPGQSLHHAATEFDLAVGAAGSPVHRWLTSNAGRFNFIQRYSWPFHPSWVKVPPACVPVRSRPHRARRLYA